MSNINMPPPKTLANRIQGAFFRIGFTIGVTYLLISMFPTTWFAIGLVFGLIVASFIYWKQSETMEKNIMDAMESEKIPIEMDQDAFVKSMKILYFTYNVVFWTFMLAAIIWDFPREIRKSDLKED